MLAHIGSRSGANSLGANHVDWKRVARVMKYPRIVFGSSVCLHAATLEAMGFSVEILGLNQIQDSPDGRNDRRRSYSVAL